VSENIPEASVLRCHYCENARKQIALVLCKRSAVGVGLVGDSKRHENVWATIRLDVVESDGTVDIIESRIKVQEISMMRSIES